MRASSHVRLADREDDGLEQVDVRREAGQFLMFD